MSGVCCKCGGDDRNYLDPLRRLRYSKKCGHVVCESCHRGIFATTHRGGHITNRCPAPGCVVLLVAGDFTDESPEEREQAEEVRIRAEMASHFNLSLADFGGDTAAYNNYLEMVETYTANKVLGIDVEATDRAIAAYLAANQEAISRNRAARADEARRADLRLKRAAAARAAAEGDAAAADEKRRQLVATLPSRLADVMLSDAASASDRAALRERLLVALARKQAEDRLASSKKAAEDEEEGEEEDGPPPIPPSFVVLPAPAVPKPSLLRRANAYARLPGEAAAPPAAAAAAAAAAAKRSTTGAGGGEEPGAPGPFVVWARAPAVVARHARAGGATTPGAAWGWVLQEWLGGGAGSSGSTPPPFSLW